jgi:hypothetical protein
VSTEPLCSNSRGDTHTETQTDGRDLCSTPLRWVTQTHREHGDLTNLLLYIFKKGKLVIYNWYDNYYNIFVLGDQKAEIYPIISNLTLRSFICTRKDVHTSNRFYKKMKNKLARTGCSKGKSLDLYSGGA